MSAKRDTDKLRAIRAKCVELLAIAEKRTAGEWFADHRWHGVTHRTTELLICTSSHGHPDKYDANRSFIASCAGPAEAGWRATIAAIDDILTYWELHKDTEIVSAILTAWEGLL